MHTHSRQSGGLRVTVMPLRREYQGTGSMQTSEHAVSFRTNLNAHAKHVLSSSLSGFAHLLQKFHILAHHEPGALASCVTKPTHSQCQICPLYMTLKVLLYCRQNFPFTCLTWFASCMWARSALTACGDVGTSQSSQIETGQMFHLHLGFKGLMVVPATFPNSIGMLQETRLWSS